MIGALLALLGFGLLAWWAVPARRPAPLRGVPPAPAAGWNPGPDWPAARLRAARWGGLLALGAFVLYATRNPVMAALYGAVGWRLPQVLLGQARARRRVLLDQQAYGLATALRNVLPLEPNVGAAFRALAPHTEEPLRGLLERALRREARQAGSLATALREAGQALALPDLALLGDVLRQADRLSLDVSQLLGRLARLWGDRIQQERQRLGQMTTSTQTAWIAIGLDLAVQIGWPLLSPTARAALAQPAGWAVGGAGAGLTLAALALLQAIQRRAQAGTAAAPAAARKGG